jgi:hypothetical protein
VVRWYKGIVGSFFSCINEIYDLFIFFPFPSLCMAKNFFKFKLIIFISNFKNNIFSKFSC